MATVPAEGGDVNGSFAGDALCKLYSNEDGGNRSEESGQEEEGGEEGAVKAQAKDSTH